MQRQTRRPVTRTPIPSTMIWSMAISFLAVLVLAQPSDAARFTIPKTICIEEVIDFSPPPIPSGCEIVDCCPGCPGPWSELDWRIRYDSDTFDAVILTFDQLEPEIAAGLEIDGPASWIGDNELRVEGGETFLRGFPNDPEAAVAVAYAKPDARKSARRPAIRRKAGEDGFMDVQVDQFLGPNQVNEFRTKYTLTICPPPQLPGGGGPTPPYDVVDLGPDTGDRAVILADGRHSTNPFNSQCVDDAVYRTATAIGVGNFMTQGACHEELIVFSDGNEMRLIENPSWTDPTGDVENVRMYDRLRPGVSIWVVEENSLQRAALDAVRADQLFNASNCGIGFSWQLEDQTGHPEAENLRDSDCTQVTALHSEIGFTSDHLNVYYLRDPGASSRWCGQDTILIGATADNEALAHEFGHAFSLEDTDGNAAIATTNVMADGHVGRDSFTEGQCFRANVNDCSGGASYLNTSGLRANLPGRSALPSRCCPDTTTSPQCPDLALDVVPN